MILAAKTLAASFVAGVLLGGPAALIHHRSGDSKRALQIISCAVDSSQKYGARVGCCPTIATNNRNTNERISQEDRVV